MSTDGVKIIDSDSGHDTYWGIMDLYDAGAPIEVIKERYPFPQVDFYDDFDYEIYTTAYALAVWEIGHISPDIIKEVKKVIEKGACVQTWTEAYGSKTGKRRQKELEKLWQKITSSNEKVRKPKKYKTVRDFVFELNDVLSFRGPDGNYYVTILLDIDQYRGACTYRFGKVLYKDERLPAIDELRKCEIIGRKIPSGLGMDLTNIFSMDIEEMIKHGGIDQILKAEAEKTGSYEIGMSMIGVNHKDLVKFSHQLEKVGNIKLKDLCKQPESMGSALNFVDFAARFKEMDEDIKIFHQELFRLEELTL